MDSFNDFNKLATLQLFFIHPEVFLYMCLRRKD